MPPRTHDLEFLGLELGVPEAVERVIATLDPVFEIVRYPDESGEAPVDLMTLEDAEKHFGAAQEILSWVANELHEPPPTVP